jgi:hypothetical protein
MLFINGPGHVEDIRRFASSEPLDIFRRAHERRLLDDGWILHVPSERRSRYERHIGAERRRR